MSDSSSSATNTDMFGKKIEIRCWLAATILAASIGLVYAPAVHVPFVFDDSASIIDNASITRLWPLIGTEESPGPVNAPPGMPTAGRPLVNFSLALNYHFGGLNPVGYHAFSIVVHFLNSLLLYAILWRTLVLPCFAGRFARSTRWLAFAIALVWALHPLQTEAVIYATQRSELMMAFFYLATLYCSLRYWTQFPLRPRERLGACPELVEREGSSHRHIWPTLAIIACLCGMASKEVMVSAPLMVLLFDRTFIAGSLAGALRRSWPLYTGLAATWLLLLWLRLGLPHSEAAGFGLGVPAVAWWLTQCKIFLMYLKLAIWPWPLLIHYQLPYLDSFSAAWMYVLPVLLLGFITLVLLWRNQPLGYLGTWIFAILSPTSVIPIIIEMAAERRMYLPLAAILVTVVLASYLLLQRLFRSASAGTRPLQSANLPLATISATTLLLAIAYALVSTQRLAAYNDKFELWQQVLRLQPENDTAHVSLGHEFEENGDLAEAVDHYREGIRLGREPALAHFKLGVALMKQGAHAEAVNQFKEAARLQPTNSLVRNNLAAALYMAGRNPEAIVACRAALELQPNSWWCHNHLAMALKNEGNFAEAIQSFERAVELNPNELGIYIDLADCYGRTDQPQKKIATLERARAIADRNGDAANVKNFEVRLNALRQPDDAAARKEFASLLFQAQQFPEAIVEFETALKLKPDDASILNDLGSALAHLGRLPEAIDHLQRAIRLKPNDTATHANLAQALADAGRLPEAIDEYQAVLQRDPNDAVALNHLGIALAKAGRLPESIASLRHALELKPDYVDAHNNLGLALSQSGKSSEAIDQFEHALKLDPNDADAHFNLGNTLAGKADMEAAISHFEQAVRLKPNQADIRATLGKALSRAGRHKDAIETYRAAVLAQPNFIPAYDHLAQALIQANRSDEAIATAEKAIQVARSTGQEAAAEQVEEWLKHYRSEVRRSTE